MLSRGFAGILGLVICLLVSQFFFREGDTKRGCRRGWTATADSGLCSQFEERGAIAAMEVPIVENEA
jgi:hypothetical protein